MCVDACRNLNSGNIFLRNSTWMRSFWKRVSKQTELLYHIWWENAAIIKLLALEPDSLAHVEIIKDHTRFNSYLQGNVGESLWIPGHFLVHFAGVYDISVIQELVEFILKGKIPRILYNKKIEILNIDAPP
jgi:hypothetical protein